MTPAGEVRPVHKTVANRFVEGSVEDLTISNLCFRDTGVWFQQVVAGTEFNPGGAFPIGLMCFRSQPKPYAMDGIFQGVFFFWGGGVSSMVCF